MDFDITTLRKLTAKRNSKSTPPHKAQRLTNILNTAENANKATDPEYRAELIGSVHRQLREYEIE